MNIAKVLKSLIGREDGKNEAKGESGGIDSFEPTIEQQAIEAVQDKLEADIEREITRRRREGLRR